MFENNFFHDVPTNMRQDSEKPISGLPVRITPLRPRAQSKSIFQSKTKRKSLLNNISASTQKASTRKTLPKCLRSLAIMWNFMRWSPMTFGRTKRVFNIFFLQISCWRSWDTSSMHNRYWIWRQSVKMIIWALPPSAALTFGHKELTSSKASWQ